MRIEPSFLLPRPSTRAKTRLMFTVPPRNSGSMTFFEASCSEKLGQAHFRRLVDDEADVAAARHGPGEHDGRAVDRILELAFRHEEHRLLRRAARGGEKKYR